MSPVCTGCERIGESGGFVSVAVAPSATGVASSQSHGDGFVHDGVVVWDEY